MRSRGLALLSLILSLTCAAQLKSLGSRSQLPQNTVREFCRLDYLGARLAPDAWSRMKPLTNWKDNPEWHTLIVIARFDTGEVSQSFHSARVSMHYQVLGRFRPGMGFTPDVSLEDVEFRLKEADGEWRIDSTDPAIAPHISKQRAVQWLQAALSTEKDAGNRVSIESALRQLQGTPAAAQP